MEAGRARCNRDDNQRLPTLSLGLSSVRLIVNKFEAGYTRAASDAFESNRELVAYDPRIDKVDDDSSLGTTRDRVWHRLLVNLGIALCKCIPSVTLANFTILSVFVGFFAPKMISYLVIYPFCRLVFGTLYPAYASYKAVRTKNLKEYVKWMMYWIVFALFTCTETFTDVFLSWFPFYYEVKIVLVLWLLSPATKGSSILYRKFVHPALCRREQEIDEYIAKAKDQGYHTVLNLGTKGVNYATTVIMQTAIKNFNLPSPEQERRVQAGRDATDGYQDTYDDLDYQPSGDRNLPGIVEIVELDSDNQEYPGDDGDTTYPDTESAQSSARSRGNVVRKRKVVKEKRPRSKSRGRRTRSQTAVDRDTNEIMGGGGLVQQIRKSYSLSDLTECDVREERAADEADDVLSEPRAIRRVVKSSGYNTRRSASESNSRTPMYFPEVDVDVRGPRTARTDEPDFSHIKSTEDISSGYSSADNSASLARTGSVGAGGRVRARTTRTTVTTIKRPQAAEVCSSNIITTSKVPRDADTVLFDGTVDIVPFDGTVDTVPFDGTVDAVPFDGTVDAVPFDGTVDAVPFDGAVDAVPFDGTVDAVPFDGTVDTVPFDGTVDAVPFDGTVDAVPFDGTVDAVPFDGTVDAVPFDGTVDAVPFDGTVDAVPFDGTVDTVPFDGTVDTVPFDGTVDTVPFDGACNEQREHATRCCLPHYPPARSSWPKNYSVQTATFGVPTCDNEVIIEELPDDDTFEYTNMPPLINLPPHLFLSDTDPPFIYQYIGDQVKIVQLLANSPLGMNFNQNNIDYRDQKDAIDPQSTEKPSPDEESIHDEFENAQDDLDKEVNQIVMANNHKDNNETNEFPNTKSVIGTSTKVVDNDKALEVPEPEIKIENEQDLNKDATLITSNKKEDNNTGKEHDKNIDKTSLTTDEREDTTSLDTSAYDNDSAESDDEASFGTPDNSPRSKRKSKSPKGKYGKGKAPPPPPPKVDKINITSDTTLTVDVAQEKAASTTSQESLSDILHALPNNSFKETGSYQGLQVVNPIAEKKRRHKSKSPGRIPKGNAMGIGKLLQIPSKLAFWHKSDDKSKSDTTSNPSRSRSHSKSSAYEPTEINDDQLSFVDAADFESEVISHDIMEKSDALQKLIEAKLESHPEYKFVSLHDEIPTTSKSTDV
ncbi:hypothetical protein MSG28_009622 [Choristoneura fumiferana]|uniref:Uncharacterized protein n=1 Tax=Choristoneura fumiferana TaxID=7141 RepID=A0ACC0JBV7_CHOFU|nr:hypothetical protein MSG28_009622 [Choristoneura fumiferana]